MNHYYTEPHPFWNQDVVVIGGKNSAVESALDLYRNGARVTLLVRRPDLGTSLKYWVKPDIENRIKAGQIKAVFNCRIKEITREGVLIEDRERGTGIGSEADFCADGISPGL